ncbi:hypothetical protein [Prauserella muralis]|uniref:Uncharacterized protein n=1 Tax=Prauserella muralis TaxID=588067 RepID=A0A2V4B7C7_9PSEU|nr:hypothetical protein [Prauserella muralis]PXY31285.1 hypothetical protein BAY60_02460 [Prauserella muralis]TWE14405.1 hypothetical protein FHX69_6551 [Prauserella muralis]
MSLDQLRQSLNEVHSGLSDARAHTDRAKELLEEYRRVIVASQAQAQPWLPSQLPQALEQLDGQRDRLTGIGDLLEHYQARL